eukprot:TRINITY_DN12759_c0_g1_i21.p1 TRINITY_DN12759_c0_g1~~TRINITY_DN12759_c0_g1_i21.p1  ORF type:complete len:160 (-),score=26.10 TRINITY_DN12759_c0_g1_i21:135-614(-)
MCIIDCVCPTKVFLLRIVACPICSNKAPKLCKVKEANSELAKPPEDSKRITVLCKCKQHYFEVDPAHPPIAFSPYSQMKYFPCTSGESSGCSTLQQQGLSPETLMQLMNWCCGCGEFSEVGDILCCDHFLCARCRSGNETRVGKHFVVWCRVCWRSVPY